MSTTKTASTASTSTITGIGIDCDAIADVAARLRSKHATLQDAVAYAATADCKWTTEDLCQYLLPVLGPQGFAAVVAAMTQRQIAAAVKAAKPARANQGLTLKVGQSGTVSVYGLNRFPIALYANQWRKVACELFGMDGTLFDASPIGRFIASEPTEVYPIAKWQDDKGVDTAKSLEIKGGAVKHATYDPRSGQVAVSLAEDKAA